MWHAELHVPRKRRLEAIRGSAAAQPMQVISPNGMFPLRQDFASLGSSALKENIITGTSFQSGYVIRPIRKEGLFSHFMQKDSVRALLSKTTQQAI